MAAYPGPEMVDLSTTCTWSEYAYLQGLKSTYSATKILQGVMGFRV